jgi:hypothetical protein
VRPGAEGRPPAHRERDRARSLGGPNSERRDLLGGSEHRGVGTPRPVVVTLHSGHPRPIRDCKRRVRPVRLSDQARFPSWGRSDGLAYCVVRRTDHLRYGHSCLVALPRWASALAALATRRPLERTRLQADFCRYHSLYLREVCDELCNPGPLDKSRELIHNKRYCLVYFVWTGGFVGCED